MRGKLIDVIDERLVELRRDACPETAREIRELQQLVVALEALPEDAED